MIIIDTSSWIDHLRGIDSPLDDILGSGNELLHAFVYGELLLNGLPKTGAFAEHLQGLKPAPLAAPADVSAFIVWAKLPGTGVGFVDANLLASARLIAGGCILSQDRSLMVQAERLGLAYQA